MSELFREIIAEEIERADHDDLAMVSISRVEVDGNLSKAEVSVTTLFDDGATDELVLDALESLRPRLQRAIGTQARVRRVPPLQFSIDESARSANRIDEILSRIDTSAGGPIDAEADAPGGSEGASDDVSEEE